MHAPFQNMTFERARDPCVSTDTALYFPVRHKIHSCPVLADEAFKRNCSDMDYGHTLLWNSDREIIL